MAPLRWICQSTRALAKELQNQGFPISSTKVGQLLRTRGYSLQANRKTIEGKQPPDRNAQFEHLAARVRAFQRAGQPAISLDTKKKETLGNMKNPGTTYRKKGNPRKVKTHHFPDKDLGKAVPYGVYDLTHNEAGVSVGISHDTAEFAVAAIRRWWQRLGRKRHPNAQRLLITADCGGSNSPRTRLWRWALEQLANETGLRFLHTGLVARSELGRWRGGEGCHRCAEPLLLGLSPFACVARAVPSSAMPPACRSSR
jgi:hypothetical protein